MLFKRVAHNFACAKKLHQHNLPVEKTILHVAVILVNNANRSRILRLIFAFQGFSTFNFIISYTY
jgi:hypothetical protein